MKMWEKGENLLGECLRLKDNDITRSIQKQKQSCRGVLYQNCSEKFVKFTGTHG